MNEFCLNPNVYATGEHRNLTSMLEFIWIRDIIPGKGTIYIISGFANYNGGVRFYNAFRDHIKKGGKVVAFVGGSTAQKLSSKQVVSELLDCGVQVNVINRKRLLHAKCYGYLEREKQNIIVTSANFTGPGMSQNAEAALLLDSETTQKLNFSWEKLVENINKQKWDIYCLSGTASGNPAWGLLYDEMGTTTPALDESQEMSLIITLGHADTARIQAQKGSDTSKGSQYFWLSRDCFDFFPPLVIKNVRGYKATYSALISLNYVNLNTTDTESRVTFEAENNFDFRLGTGKLRYTKLAKEGDLAIVSRIKETEYELRIIKQNSKEYRLILPYAINYIGHRGKKYGFVPNKDLEKILGVTL